MHSLSGTKELTTPARTVGHEVIVITGPALQPAAPLTSAQSDREVMRRRITDRPLDSALYSCCCGMVFDADVSANVRCPHCGSEQPW